MVRKLLVLFAVVGLAVASAKSYTVTLFQPSLIGGAELKPGDYKVELKDDKVVISNGKVKSEAPAKAEQNDTKFSSTSVRYQNGDGKYRITEIRLGGTNTKLVVNN